MNRGAILEMQPGRELDALVSKTVFGMENVGFIPYSTSIAAAWSVLEKMEQETKVSVWSDNNRKWACEVEYMIHDDCDTAPEAICKAALLYKHNIFGRGITDDLIPLKSNA